VRAGGKVSAPVLKNDYDPEGGALTVTAVTPFEGADVHPGLNGQSVDIEVAPTVVSSFTVSYSVADAAGNQASAFVDVRIVPANEVNRPPTARTDIGRTRSGVPVVIAAVANDSDPDGDIIAVESIRSQPTGGTASVERGAVVYTPSSTFVGTDRFTYALVDAGGEVAVGEVLIGVMPAAGANRAPEAFDDEVRAVAGSAPLVYDVLIAATAIVVVAAGTTLWRTRRTTDWAVAVFFAGLTVTLLAGLHWTEFQLISRGGGMLNQGRYLLPLVGIAGLAVAQALRLLPQRLRPHGAALVAGGLLALQFLALALMLDRFYA